MANDQAPSTWQGGSQFVITARPLRLRDALWCWRLAHEAGVRANSVDPTPPTLLGHVKWMWQWTRSNDHYWSLAIVEYEGHRSGKAKEVGHVRTGPSRSGYPDERELHISLFPWVRGMGYGKLALAGVRSWWQKPERLVAYVKKDNAAAHGAFTAAGWQPDGYLYRDGNMLKRYHGAGGFTHWSQDG